MINGINSVLTIFSMIGAGFLFSKKGWFTEDTQKLFSKIVVNISLPAMTIYNLKIRFTKDHLLLSMQGIGVSFASILLLFAISLLIAKMLHLSKKESSVFSVLFTFSNTVFIGFPIIISLFGEDSIAYALLYYLANTTLFWTLGVYNLSSYHDLESAQKSRFKHLKNIISPAFVSLFAGYFIVLLNIPIPEFLMDSMQYIGNLTVPLSMLFIGISFSIISIKSFKITKPLCWIIIGKFIISPIIMCLIILPLPFPSLMQKVLIIESGMPIQAQAAIVSKYYDADADFASVAVGFSTLLSIITIPIYAIFISVF